MIFVAARPAADCQGRFVTIVVQVLTSPGCGHGQKTVELVRAPRSLVESALSAAGQAARESVADLVQSCRRAVMGSRRAAFHAG